MLSEINWAAGGASVQANQLFGPYGNVRYNPGTFNTAKGFTGQYNDPFSGLDSFHARYYDPVVGVFLSADSVQGNLAGLNPYGYVGDNPETYADPSGQMYVPDPNNGQDLGKQWQHLLHNYAPASGPQSSCGSQSQLDCSWVWYLAHAHANTSIQVPASTLTGVGSVACVGGRLDVGVGGFAPAVGIGGITFGIDIGAQGGLSLPCGGGTGSGSIQVTGQGSAAAPVGGCLPQSVLGNQTAQMRDRPRGEQRAMRPLPLMRHLLVVRAHVVSRPARR